MGIISNPDFTYTPPISTSGSGIITLDSLTAPKPTASENILKTIEQILSNPALKPVIDNGARLIGEYANKLQIDNITRAKKLQGDSPDDENKNRVVFGAGAPNQ